MILSCDPGRHAFLIHFGPRRQLNALDEVACRCEGALVEIALDRASTPPTLVAIHFVRHGFLLPFVNPSDKFSTSDFHLSHRVSGERYSFCFKFEAAGSHRFEAFPGLTILTSDPPEWLVQDKKKPLLCGFEVDKNLLRLELDHDDFTFEFGTDLLKDVSVQLFVDRSGDRLGLNDKPI
ncbi:MAG: hypothetical protein ACLQG3_14265 [Terracidiphilus sp.]